jgi:hypothetical protein
MAGLVSSTGPATLNRASQADTGWCFPSRARYSALAVELDQERGTPDQYVPSAEREQGGPGEDTAAPHPHGNGETPDRGRTPPEWPENSVR